MVPPLFSMHFCQTQGVGLQKTLSVCLSPFSFPAIQTSTSGGWRGLERWFGGRRSSPCIFFTIVFTWEWMRRQDFCLAHFGGCGVWMWKYVRFGGFSPVFLCWSNAHNIKEYVNTKKFVIVTIFWEKWCITWRKCRGDKTFDNGCRLIYKTRTDDWLLSASQYKRECLPIVKAVKF